MIRNWRNSAGRVHSPRSHLHSRHIPPSTTQIQMSDGRLIYTSYNSSCLIPILLKRHICTEIKWKNRLSDRIWHYTETALRRQSVIIPLSAAITGYSYDWQTARDTVGCEKRGLGCCITSLMSLMFDCEVFLFCFVLNHEIKLWRTTRLNNLLIIHRCLYEGSGWRWERGKVVLNKLPDHHRADI